MIKLGGFFGRRLGPLLKSCLILIENMFKHLAKSVLVSLGLIPAASATEAAIWKKNLEWSATILVFSNWHFNDIMNIVKSLEKSGLLIKDVNETIENEVKEQKGGFLGMLVATLGLSFLGTMLAGKGVIRVGEGTTVRAGEGREL